MHHGSPRRPMAILVLRFRRGFQAPSARFPRITTAVRAYQSSEPGTQLRKWRWISYPFQRPVRKFPIHFQPWRRIVPTVLDRGTDPRRQRRIGLGRLPLAALMCAATSCAGLPPAAPRRCHARRVTRFLPSNSNWEKLVCFIDRRLRRGKGPIIPKT